MRGLRNNVVGGRSGSGWEVRGYGGLGAVVLAFGGVSMRHFERGGMEFAWVRDIRFDCKEKGKKSRSLAFIVEEK